MSGRSVDLGRLSARADLTTTLRAAGGSPMRRFSIAGLMAVVALAALDCLALRARPWYQHPAWIVFQLGGVPMANALVLVLLAIGRRARGTAARRFLIGVEVVGWPALLLGVAGAAAAPAATLEYLLWTLGPLLRAVRGAGLGPAAGAFVTHVLWGVFLMAHPLIPALIGGWAARRFGGGAGGAVGVVGGAGRRA